MISGLDEKEFDLKDMATHLKSKLACGGSYKNGKIELQGNHRFKLPGILEKMGFDMSDVDITTK